MPARGPRSVLCVVEVTMSAYSQGFGIEPGGDQAGEMRHVDQQDGAHRIGDLAEALEIDDARIGAAARNNHFRFVLFGELASSS